MDIKLQYPFEPINVTVDCGGRRTDGPQVNIDIINGEIDAKKSAVKINGKYHLHPFQAVEGVDPRGEECPTCGHNSFQHRYSSETKTSRCILCSCGTPGFNPPKGDSEEDNMAAGAAAGFFQAAAKVLRPRGEVLADAVDALASDHDFCLAVMKQLMEDTSQ